MTTGRLEPDSVLARSLFDQLYAATHADRGVERDSYGPGEQAAHDIITAAARTLDMEIVVDAACNLYCTLPGKDRSRTIVIGSHLDSVPQGGNFDGAAGVVMGLSVAAGWRNAGTAPPVDITVMGIRAEESTWFNASYIGSRAALGLLLPEELESVTRSDNQRSLGDHIDIAGGNTTALRQGISQIEPDRVIAFIEPHIEQGPFLAGSDIPATAVTGIRGSFRYRRARCVGVYSHSGATPRQFRSDALSASCQLVVELNKEWRRLEEAGHDLTFTIGQFSTDPREHAFSKVAGLVEFCIDVRSASTDTLTLMHNALEANIRSIADRYDVTFDLGERTGSTPALLDQDLVDQLLAGCRELGFSPPAMASGAGHDTAVFAGAGIPSTMIFIRNTNGSHNPDEAMEMSDFEIAAQLLTNFCARPRP